MRFGGGGFEWLLVVDGLFVSGQRRLLEFLCIDGMGEELKTGLPSESRFSSCVWGISIHRGTVAECKLAVEFKY